MSAGAAVLTDASRYYAVAFAADELAVYQMNKLQRLPGQLIDLQSDDISLAAMARAGAVRAQTEHS